jgi:glycosyltransferase involved in cell wall biosynthesis
MRKLVIADPSLFTTQGHHYELAVNISNGAKAKNIHIAWLANKKSDAVDSESIRVYKAFTYSMYERFKFKDNSSYHLEFAAEILNGIRQIGCAPEDHILFHTADGFTYAAIAHIFSTIDPALLPYFHLCTPYDREVMPHARSVDFDKITDSLKALIKQSNRIKLYAETRPLAEYFSAAFNSSVLPLELPPPMWHADRNGNKTSGKITIFYPGTAREEKGFLHLPQLVRQLFDSHGHSNRICFNIQATPQFVGYTPNILKALDELRQYPTDYVKLYDSALSSVDYSQLIISSDIILLLYDRQRYQIRGSGIAVEALTTGKVILTTENTFPSSLITTGNGLTGSNIDSYIEALRKLIDDFPSYKKAAVSAGKIYRSLNSSDNYIDKILSNTHTDNMHPSLSLLDEIFRKTAEIPLIDAPDLFNVDPAELSIFKLPHSSNKAADPSENPRNAAGVLSIVTPCLNAVDTIDRTIQSVVSQAGDFSINYHIQDGGSADGTVARLRHWEKELSKPNPHVQCRGVSFTWSSKADQGVYNAILKGFGIMNMALTDFMTWINGDDILLPDALATITTIAADHPEIEWIGSPAFIIDRDGNKIGGGPNLTPSAVIREGLCDGRDFHWRHLQQEGMFFKKSLWLKAMHVLQSYKLAGDWALWREFALHAEYYQSGKPLGAFRKRDGQLSITMRDEYNAEVEAALSMEKRDNAFQRLYVQRDALQANVVCAARPREKTVIEKKGVTNRFSKGRTMKPESAPLPKSHSADPNPAGDKQRMKQLRSILAYDAEWQQPPAITEKQAFSQAVKLLPGTPGAMYFGFPWATLIKQLNSKKLTGSSLMKALENARLQLKGYKFVITVCQHIHMLKYQHIFAETGITHVFWAHAVKGQDYFPEHKDIKILPFPLAAVPTSDCSAYGDTDRKYLFSFVEAVSTGTCLTETPKMIIDSIAGDKRGIVLTRNHQQLNKVMASADSAQEFTDKSAPLKLQEILEESIFSLCPSGPGPNSVRLWEALGCGSIPVVLADSYLPPGSAALWEEATVSCAERLEDIQALPERLEELARDKALIERKRHAIRQLRMLYGPDCFIYDIQKLFLSLAAEAADVPMARPVFSYGRLFDMAARINQGKGTEAGVVDVFILGCSSRLLTDPSEFLTRYKENKAFRTAYKRAMTFSGGKYSKAMIKALEAKKVVLGPVL